MRGPDTPRTNRAVQQGDAVNDYTVVLDLAADLERENADLLAGAKQWEDMARERGDRNADLEVALGSLQEMLSKQLMGLADGVQCAACGVRADIETHADNCPVNRGLKIIEEVLAGSGVPARLHGFDSHQWDTDVNGSHEDGTMCLRCHVRNDTADAHKPCKPGGTTP